MKLFARRCLLHNNKSKTTRNSDKEGESIDKHEIRFNSKFTMVTEKNRCRSRTGSFSVYRAEIFTEDLEGGYDISGSNGTVSNHLRIRHTGKIFIRWMSYHDKRFVCLLSSFELSGGKTTLIFSDRFDEGVMCVGSSHSEILICGIMVKQTVIRFAKYDYLFRRMDNKTCSHRTVVCYFKLFFYFGQG